MRVAEGKVEGNKNRLQLTILAKVSKKCLPELTTQDCKKTKYKNMLCKFLKTVHLISFSNFLLAQEN